MVLYKVFLPRDGFSLVDMFIVQREGLKEEYKGAMAKLPQNPSTRILSLCRLVTESQRPFDSSRTMTWRCLAATR